MTQRVLGREPRRLRGLVALWCTQLRRTSGHVALQTAVLLRRRWWIIRHLLPMSGALVAVLGTLLMISVNVQWLGFIPALLSRVDSREVAWGALSGFEDPNWDAFEALDDPLDYPDLQIGAALSTVLSSDTGFRELVELVESHIKQAPLGEVAAMQISSSGYTSSGRSIIGRYTVDFLLEDEPEPFIVASMTDVDDWVRDARLDWGFVHGFPVLLGGLLITFLVEAHRWRKRVVSERIRQPRS